MHLGWESGGGKLRCYKVMDKKDVFMCTMEYYSYKGSPAIHNNLDGP